MAGSQCCENPPSLNPICGRGGVETLGGVKFYFSGSPSTTKAIVLVSDIFGFEAPNLRKLADKVSAAGFFVIVPDYFHGEPYSLEIGHIHEWLKNHGTDKGFEDTKPFIAELKSKGISSIGAAGFCWGAKVVVELSKTNDIQAAVLLHPSLVTVDDIKEVKAPLAILGAKVDHISPPELVKQFEEILGAKTEVDSFVKIFPSVAHGWTVRYDTDDEAAVKNAQEAHKDTIDWFTKYV